MSFNLRFPNITAMDEAGKLRQTQSFLHQLVQELNWALNTLETGTGSGPVAEIPRGSLAEREGDAMASFNDIKPLIIKSADIVNAYYEKIQAKLEGLYVAQSDFGTYSEKTSADIQANSAAIEQNYTNVQQILSDLDMVENELITVSAHINTGLLYYDDSGTPVYGLEIGQKTEAGGEEVFNRYARFTAKKLSFYDRNDNEVAYISDYKLYITNVDVTGTYRIGSLRDTALADGSVVTKYVRGG